MSAAESASDRPVTLTIRDLVVDYRSHRGGVPFRAVDSVSLSISARETLGLVGESGSGKSTIGRAILGLTPVTGGTVNFRDQDITHLRSRQRRALASHLQVIFQDPYSSLNPTRTIGQTLRETLLGAGNRGKDDAADVVIGMLARVGMPATTIDRYPAAFSGGQRQRIAIARALLARPGLVLCDEAVSALDLSVQAQVLNLLRELQDDLSVSYLFISHDLAVVRHVSHRIVVLYRGRVLEEGSADAVYRSPRHPYTVSLLDAAPAPDPETQRRRRAARESAAARSVTPRPTGVPGCAYAGRCPWTVRRCLDETPVLRPLDTGTSAACHRLDEIDLTDIAMARASGRPRHTSVDPVGRSAQPGLK